MTPPRVPHFFRDATSKSKATADNVRSIFTDQQQEHFENIRTEVTVNDDEHMSVRDEIAAARTETG